jgi:hypothetical protein
MTDRYCLALETDSPKLHKTFAAMAKSLPFSTVVLEDSGPTLTALVMDVSLSPKEQALNPFVSAESRHSTAKNVSAYFSGTIFEEAGSTYNKEDDITSICFAPKI